MARAAARAALGRIAPRLIPGLNLALLAYEFYEWYRQPGMDMTGWTNYCGSGGSIVLPHFRGCGGDVKNFNTEEGSVDPGGYLELATKTGTNWLGILNYDEYHINSMWTATAGTAAPSEYPAAPLPEAFERTLPEIVPAMPPYAPYEPPAWEPDQRPANDPLPERVPDDLPWRAIPYRIGVDFWQTWRGNEVPEADNPWFEGKPRGRGPGGLRPTVLPPNEDDWRFLKTIVAEELRNKLRDKNDYGERPKTWPQVQPVLVRRTPTVRAASHPPGRGTKERKIKVVAPAIAKALINAATESCDFVGALFEAIPAKQRIKDKVLKKLPKNAQKDRKKPTQQWQSVGCPQQAAYVWKHLDKVDPDKAIKNLLVNELIDRGVGKANQRTNNAYVKANRGTRVGIGFGSAF